jgi:hypothetical protein
MEQVTASESFPENTMAERLEAPDSDCVFDVLIAGPLDERYRCHYCQLPLGSFWLRPVKWPSSVRVDNFLVQ